jgi:uncharacterized protein
MAGGQGNGGEGQRQCGEEREDDPDPPAAPRIPVLPCQLVPATFLALSPLGGYPSTMSEPHIHATHSALITRLKRAEGHLRHVITMIENGNPCQDIATQLLAVERAVGEAKRTLIHDHIDHCLGSGPASDLTEIKAMTKLL